MRIVSLIPSITEALCMLGLEDSLVGVTDYCLYPAEVVASKKRIGGTKTPRLGDIQALAPDLVIVNTDENRRQTFERLQSAGLRALVTQTDSLDEVEATWTQLGEATGTAGLAGQYRQQIASARRRNRKLLRGLPSLPTLVPVWRDPWMASGPGTYMESLLAECGFRNIMSQAGRKWIKVALGSTQANDAYPLPERPDVVLLPSEPYHFGDKDRDDLVDLGFRREQVQLVDGVLLSWWLSRTVEALEHFRELHLTQRGAEPNGPPH